jgi:hypothetical protein
MMQMKEINEVDVDAVDYVCNVEENVNDVCDV